MMSISLFSPKLNFKAKNVIESFDSAFKALPIHFIRFRISQEKIFEKGDCCGNDRFIDSPYDLINFVNWLSGNQVF